MERILALVYFIFYLSFMLVFSFVLINLIVISLYFFLPIITVLAVIYAIQGALIKGK